MPLQPHVAEARAKYTIECFIWRDDDDAGPVFDGALATFRAVYDATPEDPEYAGARLDAASEAMGDPDHAMDLGGLIYAAFEADLAADAAQSEAEELAVRRDAA